MPSIRLTSGLVHYIDEGKGRPIIMLHANPGDGRDFSAIIPSLASKYRVIAIDWPGYGASDIPSQPDKVNVLYFYQVLCEFLETLAIPPAAFVGNSLGGNVAARLAACRPDSVRAIILAAPGGFTSKTALTRAFSSLQASSVSLPPRWFASVYLRLRTPTVREMLKRARMEQSHTQRIALSRALWRSFATRENDLREEARSIKAPTLLILGSRDPVISAKRDGRNAAQAISGSQLVCLPCGHAPFAEMPQRFLAEILPFLARCYDT